jgi:hypothetical protein
MRALMVAVLVVVSASTAEETKLGTGVTLEKATPIASLTTKPEEFVGKTIRIDGVATAVCTSMGCWMAVAPADAPASPTVRLKVEDGVIVFPISAKGKRVSAQGVFEAIGGDAHGKEAAGEHAKHDTKASKDYQIKATGAIVRE